MPPALPAAMPLEVTGAFAAFDDAARAPLLVLRGLILETAAATPGAGPVTEALRWGQPAYLAPRGSTLRLGVPKTGGVALYAHCRTRIIPEFRAAFGDAFRYDGNRAVLLSPGDEIAGGPLVALIRHALSYHMPSSARSAGSGEASTGTL